METTHQYIRCVESLLLGLYEEGTRRVKEVNLLFGGMLIIFIGDPYQLAAISHRKRLYDEHYLSDKVAAQHGRRLYQAVKNVIYLEENMRFPDDIEWGNELARARRGEWTTKMKEILKSRYSARIEDSCTDFQNKYTQVISSDNATRESINKQILKNIATTTRVFKVPSRIGPQEKLEPGVFRLLDNKTQGLPAIDYFYPGMQVRLKSNQCVPKGVANGMFGLIHHIEWPSDADFTNFDNDGFCFPTREPTNIFVDIPGAPQAAKDVRFPGLCAEWPTTVMPIYRERKAFQWKKNSMHITQFPIVPAFASTCYGAQGATYETVCVTNLRPAHYRTPDPHSLYVALSRVRRSKHLIMMYEIPDEDFAYFRPNKATIAEDNRLLELSANTVESFRAATHGRLR